MYLGLLPTCTYTAASALQGYHGDTSRMYYAGKVSDKAQQLCETTEHAMMEAIKVCGPGVHISEIGKVGLLRAVCLPLPPPALGGGATSVLPPPTWPSKVVNSYECIKVDPEHTHPCNPVPAALSC